MRFIKISTFILVIGIIANSIIVNASSERIAAPVGVAIQKTLTANLTEHIGTTYQKNNESNQTYSNTKTYTTMTNPCPKCVIKVTAVSGNMYSNVLTKMGNTQMFENSGIPAVWTLELQRFDNTLLKTTTHGEWIINGN